jgi:arsenite oxidase small subunit
MNKPPHESLRPVSRPPDTLRPAARALVGALPVPQWRHDFPIRWESDHYVTRRELAKFLTLGSGLLAGANVAIAALGRAGARTITPRPLLIGSASTVPPHGSMLFRFPTEDDPCILLRGRDGGLRAFSQVCTHLSCAVVHRPETSELFCPCHQGRFSDVDGRPKGGPPTRRLPLIRIEQRGDAVYALDKEV